MGANPSVRDAVRHAYLLGRTEQAAYSFDALVKTCRSQAEAKEQAIVQKEAELSELRDIKDKYVSSFSRSFPELAEQAK